MKKKPIKKCKVCGLEFTSTNQIRKYCDFHLYGQNKDVTDINDVKRLLEEQRKKLEEYKRLNFEIASRQRKVKEVVDNFFKENKIKNVLFMVYFSKEKEARVLTKMYRDLVEIYEERKVVEFKRHFNIWCLENKIKFDNEDVEYLQRYIKKKIAYKEKPTY